MLGLLLLPLGAAGQTLAHKGWAGSGLTIEQWWEHAVFYQVDPLSFQDSDGDGYGDLRGLARRLDYLQSLGVDAVVLSPLPLHAAGAALSFDAAYGSEEDFDRLLGEAGRRKIRVILDLPLNDLDLPLNDLPFEAASDPDAATLARFWLTRGVAGLRLVEAPPAPGVARLSAADRAARVLAVRRVAGGFAGQRVVLDDLPEIAGPDVAVSVHRRSPHSARSSRSAGSARAVQSSGGGAALAPELPVRRTLERLEGEGSAGLSALPGALRAAVDAGGSGAAGEAVLASDGTDHARSLDRLGDGGHDAAIAKVLAAGLLLSRSGALLLSGQELGMQTTPGGGGLRAGGEPTPMQWGDLPLVPDAPRDAAVNGFTSGTPWLNMGRNAATANVAAEEGDPQSLLNWYRRLSVLHHGNAALRSGTEEWLPTSDARLAAWVRRPNRGTGAAVVVIVNLSGAEVFGSAGAGAGLAGAGLRVLARSGAGDEAASAAVASATMRMSLLGLEPYGVVVGEVVGAERAEAVGRGRRR